MDERHAPGARRHRPPAAGQRAVAGRRPGRAGRLGRGGRCSRSPYPPAQGWGGSERRPARAARSARGGDDLRSGRVHPGLRAGRARGARAMSPDVAEGLTGVPAADIERAARTLWESRPVAFYTWSGLEQHSGTTQIIRAINQLYALTGQLRRAGRQRAASPRADQRRSTARSCWPRSSGRRRWGSQQRPLGPARFEFVTGEDVWSAALDGRPYRARGLVNFGANLVMAHGDSRRVRDALATLDFFVHADLFMSPTAELADVVLPVTSAFEHEALRVGFEVERGGAVARAAAPPAGRAPGRGALRPARSSSRWRPGSGVGEHFWDGDLDAAWRHQLAPSGLTLEQLRSAPGGRAGAAHDLATASTRRSMATACPWLPHALPGDRAVLRDAPRPRLPAAPAVRRAGDQPALPPRPAARRYPLILTCAKSLHFCETQHRNLPSLRRRAPDPEVELHPDDRRRPRHRGRRLGPHLLAPGRGPRPGQAQRIPRPRGGLRPARLVAALPRPRPRRLTAVRSRQRQPQPDPAARHPAIRSAAALRFAPRSARSPPSAELVRGGSRTRR